ncbi:MAG: tRNA pseudouridine(13) synthase TruD [Gammaproteobacteria bacterium]|jgi:tRNA pseudouridine13 synthase|nr:tRNA pseudouridine(13) synthase TruD [Gammaproteobacteria bacterium]
MSMQGLAYASSEPVIAASYKVFPEDFQVKEILNFEPDGEGDHLFLYVEKKGLTTQEVQKRLMQYFKLPDRDVSFSGMKDKHALTQQWFSVKQGNNELRDAKELNSEQLHVQRTIKNKRKLRRGSHHSNQFSIRLRDLSERPKELIDSLQNLSLEGVPNYFGEQRFGRNGGNVDYARKLFNGSLKIKERYKRNLYISAARAHLFNLVLSQRVEEKTWSTYTSGDVMSLDGSSASFKPENWDKFLADRLDKKDIHPSGPMWGAGKLKTEDLSEALEEKIVSTENELKLGLEKIGLEQERRALRSMPENLSYKVEDDKTIVLEFSLAKGAYATSFLRELVKLRGQVYVVKKTEQV